MDLRMFFSATPIADPEPTCEGCGTELGGTWFEHLDACGNKTLLCCECDIKSDE